MLDQLIRQLGAAGAALILEGGDLVLESVDELPAGIVEELRRLKPEIVQRLKAEEAAPLGLWCEAAIRFLGVGVPCYLPGLHEVYRKAVELDYGADVLRISPASLDAFTLAFRAAEAPAPPAPAALDASFEEEHGERASILEHDGGMSRACADAWSRELKHLEEHGRKLARAPVACRLAVGVSFVDASYPAGVEVVVLPAGAPLDAISQDDAEWLRGRLERLHKLRRDSQHGEPEAKASARARLQAEEAFVLVRLGGVLRLVERGRLALQGDEAPRTMEGAAAA